MENGTVVTSADGFSRRHQEGNEPAIDEGLMEPSYLGGHKRSLSGNILSKLSFLRSSQDQDEGGMVFPHMEGSGDDAESPQSPNTPSGAMASALQSKKTRKRKGSLRKTALLGTGRLRLEGKDRRASSLEQVKTLDGDGGRHTDGHGTLSPHFTEDLATPRPVQGPAPPIPLSTKPNILNNSGTLANSARRDEIIPLSGLVRSPTFGDTSTTDEDDMLTFPRIANSGIIASILKQPSSSGSDYYFPGLQRRRSANKAHSPLATVPIEPASPPEEWDYSETEWWGWVVLTVTWIVFVVGMGSCFEVWSWAWDVGETPYAPPELEDDPTLPIVGYYPALIILTSVMAWVWVVVAWVGMKYFRHAKISGEDI
ncbi:hypothetical protein MMC24_006995 [Lignoscripta atroalba]|nr:hypothetical protein [Lignoscripta atroalba]